MEFYNYVHPIDPGGGMSDLIERGVTADGLGWQRAGLGDSHPAPDLDAPPPAGDDRLHARGYIQLGQAWWVKLDAIAEVFFNTGPGEDYAEVHLAGGIRRELHSQEARDFWVAWTAYLAGDD